MAAMVLVSIFVLVSAGWAVYFCFLRRNWMLSALSIGNIALCVCMTNMGPLAQVCLLPLVVCMIVAGRPSDVQSGG
ncbi:MAG: hypothetical protein JST35_07490 [Armatimonadetes bacterium]|nr:hypothetical protein [Armatimonadota bacterium]